MDFVADIVLDALKDTLSLVPFLFVTYLVIEGLAHTAGNKVNAVVKRAGAAGPVVGALLGIVPQCGFSAMAATLYAGRIVTLGTLVAVFLSTSDEMLPMLVAEQVPVATMAKILAMKAGIAVASGFAVDALIRALRHNERVHAALRRTVLGTRAGAGDIVDDFAQAGEGVERVRTQYAGAKTAAVSSKPKAEPVAAAVKPAGKKTGTLEFSAAPKKSATLELSPAPKKASLSLEPASAAANGGADASAPAARYSRGLSHMQSYDHPLEELSADEAAVYAQYSLCSCGANHAQGEKPSLGFIVQSALRHTVQVSIFIFLVTLILVFVLETVGEPALEAFLKGNEALAVLGSALVGLVPNCSASVVITQLYLEGVLQLGPMMAGTLVSAGVGYLVLFRTNESLRQNVVILAMLYVLAVAWGFALTAFGL